MNNKILMIFAVLLIFVCQAPLNGSITNVSVSPPTPTLIDPITLSISGVEPYGAVEITNTDFSINGYVLQLDITLNVGHFSVVTPWSHSEPIGALPSGFYDLTVKTIQQDVVTDVYSTSFEVVPEPSTIALLGLGLPFLRVFSARRREK